MAPQCPRAEVRLSCRPGRIVGNSGPCCGTKQTRRAQTQTFDMIHLGNQLRLTGREVERFTRITGIEPVGVKSLDDLDDYIGRCKDYYQGASHEARFLRWLLDEERSRCLCAA